MSIASLEKGGRSKRDKLDRRRSTKLTVPLSVDARLPVYHNNHQALSTAQFRRASQLATADTCSYCRTNYRARPVPQFEHYWAIAGVPV